MPISANIREYIASIITLEDSEWELIANALDNKTLAKDDFFLKEGQVCNAIAFINTGALIYYKDLENGDQMTTDFAFERDWVTDNYSRLNNCPSLLNIKAIEETNLYNKRPRLIRTLL